MPEAPTRRERRREEILEAARTLVAREGLGALTFAALEERLAFTRGVITYHFKNKEEIVHGLLDAALGDIGRAAREAVERTEDPADAVEAAVAAMVQGFLTHRDATFVLVSFWGRLATDERARDANARLYARYRTDAAALVRRGQEVGRFRTDADAEAAGAVMVGAVIGIVAQVIFEEGAVDVDASVRTAARSLACWLVPGAGFP